jgi:hypothetical protein
MLVSIYYECAYIGLLNDQVTFIYWYLNFQIKGKACGICKNSENETLHVRNICFDWSKDDVRFLAYLV